MPLGWRVHQRVVQVIREEMNAIGGQEMLCPSLTPAELWEQTGSDHDPGALQADRTAAGGTFVLPLTHEESMTFHARELQSVQAAAAGLVPLQHQRPRRAAPARRPAAATRVHHEGRVLVRPRPGGARRELRPPRATPTTGSSSACGVEAYAVQAESGMMGGKESIDFLAPSGSGENTLVTLRANGDYAADLEVARGVPRTPEFPAPLAAPEEIETPGVTTIEALAEFLGIDPAATSKAMPVVVGDGTRRARARPRRRPARGGEAADALERGLPPGDRGRDPRGVRRRAGGSIGPVGFSGEVIADESLREGQFVAGANRDRLAPARCRAGRDFEARVRRHPAAARRAMPARSAAAS